MISEIITDDMVLIDEFSMVGIDTLYAICSSLSFRFTGNVVLVGDANQLPSVSPSNFLSDIMKTDCANIVKLDKIHRQDENSYISLIANDVSGGKIVDKIPEDASDLQWTTMTAEQTPAYLAYLIQEFMKDHNIDDIQIIAPMYKGTAGITNINAVVQNLLVNEKTS